MALVQPTSNDDALLDQLIDAGVLATDQSAPPVTEPTQPGSIATAPPEPPIADALDKPVSENVYPEPRFTVP